MSLNFKDVFECVECPLCWECKGSTAWSEAAPGKWKGRWMLVGEAPGKDEERKGVGFVGKSGEYLWDELWQHCRITRDQVHVSNVVKCRPVDKKGGNRTPTPEEAAKCADVWLKREVIEYRPNLLVAFGVTAARELAVGFGNMEADHGKLFQGKWGVPVYVVYHPSAALRDSNTAHKFAWDLKGIKDAHYDQSFNRPKFIDTRGAKLTARKGEVKAVAIDTETEVDDEVDTDSIGSKPWSMQVSVTPDEGIFFDAESARGAWRRLFKKRVTENTEVILHNAMFDLPVMKRMGVDLLSHPKLVDTMIACEVLQDESKGLKVLGRRYGGMDMRAYSQVVKKAQDKMAREYVAQALAAGKNGAKWWSEPRVVVFKEDDGSWGVREPWSVEKRLTKWAEKDGDWVKRWKDFKEEEGKGDIERALGSMPVAGLKDVDRKSAVAYSCLDSIVTYRVWEPLKKRLEELDLMETFQVDMQAMKLVVRMQEEGLPVNVEQFEKCKVEFGDKLKEIDAEIEEAIGRKINAASAKQTSELIYDELGLPVGKLGKTTGSKVLEQIEHLHPVVKLIREYREYKKLIGTYCEPIIAKCEASPDERLRARLNPTGTETGRMTAKDPNVLGIPSRTEHGRMVKRAFEAEEGWCILDADYSQVELRVFAHETQEQAIIDAYREDADIHSMTAARAMKKRIEDVTKEDRAKGKTLNFGIIYGIGADGLSRQLNCDRWEAQRFIDGYFEGYQSVDGWMSQVISGARKNGYVRDMFGRIRWMGWINSEDKGARRSAERQACNAMIQGAASGMIKRAMGEVYERLEGSRRWKRSIRPLLQVHDSLIFEVKCDIVEEFGWELIKIMEGVVELDVPIIAEATYGKNWADQEFEIERKDSKT